MAFSFDVDPHLRPDAFMKKVAERALPWDALRSGGGSESDAKVLRSAPVAVSDPATRAPALLDAVTKAYNWHLPLSIAPDHVWLTILHGLSIHIDLHAEEMRKHFVAHEGTKELVVQCNEFRLGANNDWGRVIDLFAAQIKSYIGKKHALLANEFSTTSPVELTAGNVLMMGAMRSYFRYTAMTLCGFPRVTIEGTPEDWETIQRKVAALSELGLEWWTEPMREVLDKFVLAAHGSPDIEFFRSMYRDEGGSGGPHTDGWINVFYPYITRDRGKTYTRSPLVADLRAFDKGGCAYVCMNETPATLGLVDGRWVYYSDEYPLRFVGGLAGVAMTAQGMRPVAGWAVTVTR